VALSRAPLGWRCHWWQIGLGMCTALSPLKTKYLDPEGFFVLFLPPLLFLDG
jgi:hypothetical protein